MFKIILLGWIAGIAMMGRTLEWIEPFTCITGILTFLIWAIYFYRKRKHQIGSGLRALVILISASFLFGIGAQYADSALEERLHYKVMHSDTHEVIIYVHQMGESSDKGIKQVAEVLNIHPDVVNWVFYIDQSLLGIEKSSSLELGQYYRITAKTKPIHSYALEGAFDVEKWFVQQNWQAAAQVYRIQTLSKQEVMSAGFYLHVKQQQTWRAQFLQSVEKLRLKFRNYFIDSSLSHHALLLALLTGDRSLLNPELEQQFQRFGISHLLAISGPHVLIFAAMVSWIFTRLIHRFKPEIYLSIPRQKLVLLPFLMCVILYCAFVGFEIPALRTLFTVMLGSILLLIRHHLSAFSLLVLSASLLLWMDPFSILSAAFWLSYGACFILIRIYQDMRQAQQFHQTRFTRGMQILKALVRSQWKIFVALMPLTLIIFKQISWIAPLSNLIVIPILGGIIVPLDIMAGCLWLFIPSLGNLLFSLNNSLLELFIGILKGLDHLFNPQLQYYAFTPLLLICLTLAIVILFLPKGVVPKFWSVLCCVPLLIPSKMIRPTQISILDVGQGQSIFIQDQTQRILLDTGGYYDESKFSIGKQVVVPFLKSQGVHQLDRLILTHLDQDHSGGLPAVLQSIPTRMIQANEEIKDLSIPFSLCHSGQTWETSELKIQILSPKLENLQSAVFNRNEASCVMYLQLKQASDLKYFLMMGDAGWETEYQLLQQYPDLKVDVLILGHHGSQHSSSYDFLKRYHPKIAIASSGFENRYGHPSAEVSNRLQDLNIPLLSTTDKGAIHFKFDSGNEQTEFYRQSYKWLQR